MKPDIKAEWVAALRSGAYRQARGVLHAAPGGEHRFCCLGVLCDVVKDRVGLTWRAADPSETWSPLYQAWIADDDFEDQVLPRGVAAFAGLDGRDPVVTPKSSLGRLNDSGMSFAEIADVIEERL